jgi:hypothetical protein
VEQVDHTPLSSYEGSSKEGGIRLGKSLTALVEVLRDVTPRLQLVGCSLRVVGRLLRDVGRIPGDVNRVRQEVGRIFSTVFYSLFFPFFPQADGGKRGKLLLRGLSRILPSCLFYEGDE